MGELERMAQIRQYSQPIGEFLDWLKSRYTICQSSEYGYWPALKSTEELLAEYFEIDLEQAERERRELLEKVRERQCR
jgi:hypothetical protein